MKAGDTVRSKHDGEIMTVKKRHGAVVVCIRHTQPKRKTIRGEVPMIAFMRKGNLEVVPDSPLLSDVSKDLGLF